MLRHSSLIMAVATKICVNTLFSTPILLSYFHMISLCTINTHIITQSTIHSEVTN